ncbi:HotDog domain-containing protein [Aspergillus karnatakaensis]|uniref:HotDog domain-containing protein n=1 Tax=Aspergillus karnatakaensis TaxID=1810916 RepID=UPI003CCD5FC5
MAVAGFEFPPREVSWFKRDVLFAISIGVPSDELHFLYELSPSFSVFPTYPLILPFKHADQEVIDFYTRNALNNPPTGPLLDWRYVVDGQRKLTIHKPLPVTSQGRRFELHNKVIGLYDKGKSGSAYETQQRIVDAPSGEVYSTILTTYFLPGQGGWGGPRGPAVEKFDPPARTPDAIHRVETTESTVYLYRLNGDYNPLHADPSAGEKMGFDGVIVHGLFTWNSACYGVLKACADSDPDRLKEFQARFAAPVRPGDVLVTEIWKMGWVEGEEEVRFLTRVEKGKVVLGNGRALLSLGRVRHKI